MENGTLELIRKRRSIRAYADKPVETDKLRLVAEAGQYAPNAGDEAWHFTVVQNRALLDELNRAAKETARSRGGNFQRLGSMESYDCLYGAPALVIVSGDITAPMPLEYDCAAATQNMLLAAEALGLSSCWIYFVLLAFESPSGGELRSKLQIPENYKPTCAAVFGYGADTMEPPERKPGCVTFIS